MRKVRGQKRRLKQIGQWRRRYVNVDLAEWLQRDARVYAQFRIHPWGGIVPHGMDPCPPPRGESRRQLVSALLDIHDSWHEQLTALGEPFYLKIWLYEPQIERSEVVCAVGEWLNFYDNTFLEEDDPPLFHPSNYGRNAMRMSGLEWECRREARCDPRWEDQFEDGGDIDWGDMPVIKGDVVWTGEKRCEPTGDFAARGFYVPGGLTAG